MAQAPLFTFAVVSDSHVNEADDRSASPFASNRLANARFRYVVRELNRRKPAFVVHLGDMGNPLPELPSYNRAAASFHAIVKELKPPLHLVPGNHCVGDKPRGWVPVPRVCSESLDRYETNYGASRYAFDHGPCRFVILNSLVINSELDAEQAQRRWLEKELDSASAGGRRIFVMMHYPPYIAERGEPGSYDNLDEPGRSWLLGTFERFGVEAAYTGHVHNYFYNRCGGTHLYTVPATSFVRQDYSELFRVAPADDEGGRNDVAKLGYFLVTVSERGHTNEWIRSYGKGLAEGAQSEALEPAGGLVPRPAPGSCLGTEMRDNWLSREALRPNNSVSPFTRRRARNDWAILALQEMGVSKVRLALQELTKTDVASRMAPLKDAGFEFTVFSYGAPGDADYDAIRQYRSLLSGWELMLTSDQIEFVATRILPGAGSLAGDEALPRYLDEVRDVNAADIDDANVKHVSNYGFQPADLERLEHLARSESIRRAFAGFVFRLRRRGEPDLDLWPAIRAISESGRGTGLRHQVHVLFSGNVTADRLEDDSATANRVAEATFAALLAGNVDLYYDTFEDVDRGYFVRNGLVDRRYNPRPAARVIGHLAGALQALGVRGTDLEAFDVAELAHGRLLRGPVEQGELGLLLPERPFELRELPPVGGRQPGTEALLAVELASGALSRSRFESSEGRVRFERALAVEGPLLMSLGATGGSALPGS